MRFPSGSKPSVGRRERDRNLFLFPRICIKIKTCTAKLKFVQRPWTRRLLNLNFTFHLDLVVQCASLQISYTVDMSVAC